MKYKPGVFAVVAVALCLFFANASAQDDSKPGHAAIASAHKLATAAGFEVLAEGGNGFDAAVAVAAALSVLEPQSSGIGGGGFFLLRRASDGKEVLVDARETAPAAVDASDYTDASGEANRNNSINGPLSAAIPSRAAASPPRWRPAPSSTFPSTSRKATSSRSTRATTATPKR
jgi:gamma-glutamyltranspeptidase/glutathione hydrolase